MKIDEITNDRKYPYNFKCKCSKEYEVLTQDNYRPEYETEIYLKCECGEYVEMILPVN